MDTEWITLRECINPFLSLSLSFSFSFSISISISISHRLLQAQEAGAQRSQDGADGEELARNQGKDLPSETFQRKSRTQEKVC